MLQIKARYWQRDEQETNISKGTWEWKREVNGKERIYCF
jgi:hypothetical protein